jgi:hypothetical protein
MLGWVIVFFVISVFLSFYGGILYERHFKKKNKIKMNFKLVNMKFK